MARSKNELLQTLENDESIRSGFVVLMNTIGDARRLADHINKYGIDYHRSDNTSDIPYTYPNTYTYKPRCYLSWQTMSNIIRRLGFRIKKGRPVKYPKTAPSSQLRYQK